MVVPPALLSHASTPQYILDAVIVCLGGIDFGSVQQQPGDPERSGSEALPSSGQWAAWWCIHPTNCGTIESSVYEIFSWNITYNLI